MNILLLGNGFDLHHKFPTSYIDFLYTIKFLAENYDKSMDTVAKVFGDDRLKRKCKNISDSFAEYESSYKEIHLDSDTIKLLIEKANNNMWFKYLSIAVEKELTWIDFEKQIAIVIDAFDEFFSYDELYFDPYNPKRKSDVKYIISRFDYFYEASSSHKFKMIKNNYILEKLIGSKIKAIDKSKIIKELYDSLCELADMLKMYLQIFVDSLCEEIKKSYQIKNPSYPHFDYVCTFNYTNTYELLYNSSTKVSHIHGNVKDDVILGINPDKYDDLETVDTLFIQFKKYFQRVFYGTDLGFLDLIYDLEDNEIKIHKDNVSLYVAGHSLDKTDEDIIQSLFKHANKIVVFYHDVNKVGDYIDNLVSIYGKKGFDELRQHSELRFLPHEQVERCTYDQL